jgi:hypothetical protein
LPFSAPEMACPVACERQARSVWELGCRGKRVCGSVFLGKGGLVGSVGVNGVIGFCTAQLKGNPEGARTTTKKARADGVVGFLSCREATRHREPWVTGV